ncbi:unnamed protein product, partial [Ascophyllum nodosum]
AKAKAEDKISLLRKQVKTLTKERNMDLKLLEGATRKKMAEPKEELRAINSVGAVRLVNAIWSHPHTTSNALRIEAAGQRYKQTTEF